MNEKLTLNELKAVLFSFINETPRNYEQLKKFLFRINKKMAQIIGSSELIFLYLDEQLNGPIIYPREVFGQEFNICHIQKELLRLYTEKETNVDVILIEQNEQLPIPSSYQYHVIFKLQTLDTLNGFVILSFEDKPQFQPNKFQAILEIISGFIKSFYDRYEEFLMNERNEKLIRLSAILHSVNTTTEVLEGVYRSIQQIYPSFKFRFLMSHEYKSSKVPIELFQYAGQFEDNLGNLAFIKNEIQVEQNDKENNTIIYSPLSGKQGVYGVIEITIPKLLGLQFKEINFIEKVSDIVGFAVERTTLFETSNKLVTDLQAINRASRDLNKNLEKVEISANVRRHILQSCQAEQIGIILFNEPNSYSDYVVSKESTNYFFEEESSPLVSYLVNKIEQNPEPILSGNFKGENINSPFHSIIVIPMWDSEGMIGMIIVAHGLPYYFSLDKYKFVQSFVQHVSLAYTNSHLKEKLRKMAITDYLTKLYSRNYLDEQISEHMRFGNNGSLILFDVDDFKLINDTHGHYIGDSVLVQVAKIILENSDQHATAARWGGEEFAIYLPDYSIEAAIETANAIREKVWLETDPQVSLSAGIADWERKHDTIDKLFIRADEALYKAKLKGKNRIVIH